MGSIVALALKDLLILLRARSSVFFTFVWPVVVAVLFGFMFSGQSQGSGRGPLRIVVVDEDNTDGSRGFVDRLEQSGDFALERATRAQAETRVRLGQRSAFVVLKPGFGAGSERMFYGAPRELEIGNDPARRAEAGMIEGLMMKHAMQDIQKLFADPGTSRKMIDKALGDLKTPAAGEQLAPLKRFLGELDMFLGTPLPADPTGNTAAHWQPLEITKTAVARETRRGPINSFEVTFPQGVVWGIIGCVMTFAVSLVSERVRGTFVRLRMAPLTRGQVLGGKALACFASIAVVQIVLFVGGAILFNIRPSSVPLLIAACASAAIGFVGFMMMVASFGRTEQALAGAGWAMLMPMAMFGGAMIPQFVMPSWMLAIGNISPVKWAILAIEGAVWRGFSPADMILPCAVLLGFGALCFALGSRGLRDA